jgi:predicted amidohydrolase
MKVALLQVDSPPEELPSDRVARVGRLVCDQQGADLVVLPELWPVGYFSFDSYRSAAESLAGPLATEIASWARQLGCHVHAGSLVEAGEDSRLFNTAIMFGPDGSVVLTYRKIHVFGYESEEARLLTGGDTTDVVDTALGRIATSTCYDLRFPELYRIMVESGAEIVIVPAAWPQSRLAHWQLFTRARAVENQVYVLACNAAGLQHGVRLAGHSAVVDPWGVTVAEAGPEVEVVRVDLDLGRVAAVRREFPVLDDRRFLSEPAHRPSP